MVDSVNRARAVHVGVPHDWTDTPPGTGASHVCGICGVRRSKHSEHAECNGRGGAVQPSTAHDYEPLE